MKEKTDQIADFINIEIIPCIDVPESNDEKQIEKYIKKIIKEYKSRAKENNFPTDKEIIKMLEDDLKIMMKNFFK